MSECVRACVRACVRVCACVCTLLYYQAKVITLSGKRGLLHYQAELLHYQDANLLHY